MRLQALLCIVLSIVCVISSEVPSTPANETTELSTATVRRNQLIPRKRFESVGRAYRIPAGITFDNFYENLLKDRPDMITVTSPEYPLPYPIEGNTKYKLTVTNTTGMEIIIHKLDIDPLSDFLQLTPLNTDGTERRPIILTGKLKEPLKIRALGFTEVDAVFGAWTDKNHTYTGFLMSYTPYGNITHPPARLPDITLKIDEMETISKFLTIPSYAQQTNVTWNRMKQLLAEATNEYIRAQPALTLDSASPNNVTLTRVASCSDQWPEANNCVEVEFAITLYNDTQKLSAFYDSFLQENIPREPAGLDSKQLEEMWQRFGSFYFKQEGFTVYELPDTRSEILMWVGISLGVMVGVFFMLVAIFRSSAFRDRWIEDDTIKIESNEHSHKNTLCDEDITMFSSPDQIIPDYYPSATGTGTGNGSGTIVSEANGYATVSNAAHANGNGNSNGNFKKMEYGRDQEFATINEAFSEEEDIFRMRKLPGNHTHADVSV